MPKYNLNNEASEPIVAMIEHAYKGEKYVMVATEKSVYVMMPKEGGKPPYLKPIPFEDKPDA